MRQYGLISSQIRRHFPMIVYRSMLLYSSMVLVLYFKSGCMHDTKRWSNGWDFNAVLFFARKKQDGSQVKLACCEEAPRFGCRKRCSQVQYPPYPTKPIHQSFEVNEHGPSGLVAKTCKTKPISTEMEKKLQNIVETRAWQDPISGHVGKKGCTTHS